MNFAAFDLNLLRVFDAMMLELSTVRAGERIGLSQPAVSSALSRLRHALGDELFVRDGNRMLPTARAVELQAAVREALARVEDALSAGAAFDPANSAQSFMMVGSDYFSTLLMPQLAARLSPLAPSATFQMIDAPSSGAFALLGEGRADLVVDRKLETPEWIASRRLFHSWLVCVARRGHPLLAKAGVAPGAQIPLDVFCAAPHVLRSADGAKAGTIEPALAQLGLQRRIVMTVPHFQAVALAVADSDLVGSLPVRFARLVAGQLGLDMFMPPFESPSMEVTMYWHRRMDRDAASVWLRGHVAAILDVDDGDAPLSG